jgi:hypothetical protein
MSFVELIQEASTGEEYNINEAREFYINRMTNEGYITVTPESNELFIDIDTDDDYSLFQDQYKMLVRDVGVVAMTENISRGGLPGRHIRIIMAFDMTDAERIAWQASLGSDPKRELLSMMRLQRGDDYPTLFVEKP